MYFGFVRLRNSMTCRKHDHHSAYPDDACFQKHIQTHLCNFDVIMRHRLTQTGEIRTVTASIREQIAVNEKNLFEF